MTESTALRARRPRRRVSVLGVFGELLITAGVVVLLYVAWQMWIGDAIYGAERNATGQALSQQWAQEYAPPTASPTPAPDATEPAVVVPVKMDQPDDAERFAIMRIPRFGKDYAVEMAGGITRARTLDAIGIGHYPGTDMPGDVGNVAVAAHRTTWGKPFNQIAELHVGDAIVIETKAGWYTYRFRTLEYVRPNEVDVLLPVPQQMNVEATEGYLTMTSCSPMYAMTERIVGYSLFESFTPRSDGKPASLTEGVTT
ncbi:class E sortase [Microbacterium terricola]|uniref:Class E sortase n=1 Tax=Microbacterium terricola TaxID=344163 RepID=A0ABM8DUV1_9MICO|nr:class E sortase [Microbacterium terricola]UYK39889.1 class E sortase [Microbacterium terricola]BDV29355.1 class E sortase [Microbacterium terricola]